MYTNKVYVTVEEMSDYIKSKLSKEDMEKFKYNTFVPIKMDFDENSMSIDFTFIVAR